MKPTRIVICTLIILSVVIPGCAYYQVTDPDTNKIYLTRDVRELTGGAVRLKDAKTGRTVTLQDSEVGKIKRAEYRAELENKSNENP